MISSHREMFKRPLLDIDIKKRIHKRSEESLDTTMASSAQNNSRGAFNVWMMC